MIHDAFSPLGVGKKEVHAYRTLLAFGAQPASVLGRKMNIPRSSAQFLADSLVRKGLASKQTMRNVVRYEALPPEHLPRLIEAKKNQLLTELSEKEKDLRNIIPLLKEEQLTIHDRPKASFYEGEEGLQAVYEDTLSAQEPIRSLVNFEDRQKVLPEYFNNYYLRRTEKGIFIKAIYPNTPFGKKRSEKDKEELRTSHLVDAKKYKWFPEVQIYDNKVNIACGTQKIGILIEGQEIADAFKVLFDLAWEGLEEKE